MPISKWSLVRIRLNGAGYDRHGAYYGTGAPLYQATAPDGDSFEFRARDRAAAKEHVRAKWDEHARF